MVLLSSSSFIGGDDITKGKKMIELKKDVYEKDGKYVESNGHPKEWAGQGCHKVASAGQEVDEVIYKSWNLKETKAKSKTEDKAK